jgi:hypothetical protein
MLLLIVYNLATLCKELKIIDIPQKTFEVLKLLLLCSIKCMQQTRKFNSQSVPPKTTSPRHL